AATSLGMTFGDPHYMSPEQARGDSIDRRADIYSLGCIAYQMLTGEPPFVGGKVFDILTRHVENLPVAPAARRADVPAWLAGAVMRMLAKQPDERFITVYRVIEALRQGSDSGAIMTDEVARRMETSPPPSVSQAMARLGARAASELDEGGGVDLGRAATEAAPSGLADDGPTEPTAAPEAIASAAAAPEPAAAPVGGRTVLGVGRAGGGAA